MNISREELQALLGLLGITADQEINCEEFLSQLPGYLERLREKGLLKGEHAAFLHHLNLCPECREEYDGLVDAMAEGIL